jgi:hypothetical protein
MTKGAAINLAWKRRVPGDSLLRPGIRAAER